MSRRPSTDLFELIKSLTKSEKRLFKLFASRYSVGAHNKYVDLFDAIDRMHEYDETQLLGEGSVLRDSDLRSMKTYLHDLILRSLRAYSANKSPRTRIRYRIDKAMLLMDRELFVQSARLLEKAGVEAEREMRYLESLEILFLRSTLKIRQDHTNTLEHHRQLHARTMATLSALKINAQYYDLFMRMYYFQLSAGRVTEAEHRAELASIRDDPLLRDSASPGTFYAALQYHEVRIRLRYEEGDGEGAYRETRRKIELFDAHPERRKLSGYEYIYTCGSFLVMAVQQRKFDEYEDVLQKLRNVREAGSAFRVDLEANIYHAEFSRLLAQCRFDEALELIAEADGLFSTFLDRMETATLLNFYSTFAKVSLMCGDYDQCLHWTERIMESAKGDIYGRFERQARLLALLACFEREDSRLLESHIRSTYRALRRKHSNPGFERLALRFFRRIAGYATDVEVREGFRQFREECAALSAKHGTAAGIPEFDLDAWLESRIEGRSLAEVLRDRERERMRSVAGPELPDENGSPVAG